MADCRQTIEELLKEILLAGFGGEYESESSEGEGVTKGYQLLVQQVKSTDAEGNLRTTYPSKTDLVFDETSNLLVIRE